MSEKSLPLEDSGKETVIEIPYEYSIPKQSQQTEGEVPSNAIAISKQPFAADDEPRHRYVSKGTFDNQAFDAVSETPEPPTWKSGSNKLSISEPAEKNSKIGWWDVVHDAAQNFYSRHSSNIKTIVLFCFFTLYNVYLGFAIFRTWKTTKSYCEGVKFLVILTAVVYFFIIYYELLIPFVFTPLCKKSKPLIERFISFFRQPYAKWTAWAVVFGAAGVFLVIDTEGERYRLVSAGGLIVLLLLGYVFSVHRKHIIWNQVLWGVILQFIFGVIILRWDIGRAVFSCVGDKVSGFLDFTDSGSSFVFGYLVTGKLEGNLPKQSGIFAFKVLPVILFFSFVTSILYYYGIMQKMVMKVGWLLNKTMSTTACESMNAAGNIFLGMTEAPLLIKPYLPIMTKSEIHAVMTGGFATIAGGVLAAYINFGISPSHLLSASVMSAPAALAYSKLFYPETEDSQTLVENIKIEKAKEQNALEAAVNGASAAIGLVANVAANLVVFLAFIHFVDGIVIWFGAVIGWDFISFEWILSKLFVPISLIMGVEWNDCEYVARLVGLKTIVNEFVAYKSLADLMEEGKLTNRSRAIATYALCGFSNIGSIGIQLGALGSMAPERKPDLAKLGVRAMIAGSAACFMTACIAGTLMYEA